LSASPGIQDGNRQNDPDNCLARRAAVDLHPSSAFRKDAAGDLQAKAMDLGDLPESGTIIGYLDKHMSVKSLLRHVNCACRTSSPSGISHHIGNSASQPCG
jgi:hypothetical protein